MVQIILRDTTEFVSFLSSFARVAFCQSRLGLEFSLAIRFTKDISLKGSVKAVLPARRDIFRLARVGTCLFASALLGFSSCKKNQAIDEAKAAGKTTADFPQITADIFKPMDGGINLSAEEIMGRNTWNLWSAGN